MFGDMSIYCGLWHSWNVNKTLLSGMEVCFIKKHDKIICVVQAKS